MDFTCQWNPKLALTNSESVLSSKTWTTLRQDKDEAIWVVERHRIKGIFGENLELQEFPFDVQVCYCIELGFRDIGSKASSARTSNFRSSHLTCRYGIV